MGALPKQRITRHRQGNRRRHDFLKNVPVLVACNTCGEQHVVHHVCPTCGYYRRRAE
jgi:large subunit ribosomal protein L32